MLKKFVLTLVIAVALPQFAAAETVKVLMQTTKGDITLALDADKAPLTVANFLEYADAGFYNGTIFHRVIPNFMIQGGGLSPDMNKKATSKAVRNESDNGLRNVRGSIAMARTNAPHSATAQFFINHRDNASLDHRGGNSWGYAVFGKVLSGMEVVDAIAATRTGFKGGRRDVPIETIVINSVTRTQ